MFPLHTANTLCQGLRIDQIGNEQAGPQGHLPWPAPSHAGQYASLHRRCLPLPIPNSNYETPHQKLKSIRSSMLIPEGLLLKCILKPRKTKKSFALGRVLMANPENIPLEAAFRHVSWGMQTTCRPGDDLPWSVFPSST